MHKGVPIMVYCDSQNTKVIVVRVMVLGLVVVSILD